MFRVQRRPKQVYFRIYPVPHQYKPEKFLSPSWTVRRRIRSAQDRKSPWNERWPEKKSEEESEDDSRGIDLLATDDEEDEEIESENEDRAFLDDETEEQEDISFYRRLNVELDSERRQERKQQRDELALYEDVLFGQEQTRDNKVLNELEEKLNV